MPGTKRLKLKYDEPLSNVAFKFNLRRYIMGCASPVLDREGGGARLGGPGDDGEMVPMRAVTNNNSVSRPQLGEMSLDDMIAPYKCSDYDPYGPAANPDADPPKTDKVTAIKVAMFMKLPDELAMSIKLREFTMGRLFLMFATKNPVHPVLVKFVSLFDLFFVESLDISISSAPYPIEMYSGTEIPSGITMVGRCRLTLSNPS